jgi:hypothetical protein
LNAPHRRQQRLHPERLKIRFQQALIRGAGNGITKQHAKVAEHGDVGADGDRKRHDDAQLERRAPSAEPRQKRK